MASVDEKRGPQQLDVEERQMLKDLEDELLDVILVFDSMHSTLAKLLRSYSRYRTSSNAMSSRDEDDFDCIGEALQERCEDVSIHRKKIKTLHEKLKGTINLVSAMYTRPATRRH